MSKLPKITYNQLMKELDKYRPVHGGNYTNEQDEFIRKCRNSDRPITWDTIVNLWTQLGWGDISATTLSRHYKKLKQ